MAPAPPAVPCCPYGVIRQHGGKSALSLFGTQLPPSPSARFRKLFIEGRQITETGVVMSIIPLDLKRRCEQRWATRFPRQRSLQPHLETSGW